MLDKLKRLFFWFNTDESQDPQMDNVLRTIVIIIFGWFMVAFLMDLLL